MVLIIIAICISFISMVLVSFIIGYIFYLSFREWSVEKHMNKELFEEILEHITYIETNSDDMSVLAECELIRTIIKKQLKGE